jgi:predicted dehydrogenase
MHVEHAVQINLEDAERRFDPERLTRYHNAEDLIADPDLDVVDICLPTYLHADAAVAALEAGHHVFCEKPMALTVEACDRMIEAVARTGRKLMIGQCIRFWPEYVYLRRCIEEETYGALRSMTMWRIGARPAWSQRNWFLDPKLSGGPLLDLHIHDVDYVNDVFGWPDRLDITARSFGDADRLDVIHACFGYRDGPQIHMRAGWTPVKIPFESGFEAWFDHTVLRYEDGELRCLTGTTELESDIPPYETGDAYLNEIAYFLGCVDADTDPLRCTPESTRDSVALIQEELARVGTRYS